jgi:hypothetical protein
MRSKRVDISNFQLWTASGGSKQSYRPNIGGKQQYGRLQTENHKTHKNRVDEIIKNNRRTFQ